jgi:hypothetical protein
LSAQPERSSADCPLCGRPVAPSEERCPDCAYHQAGIAGRPGPFSRAALWWSAAGVVLVYVLTLVVVALAR